MVGTASMYGETEVRIVTVETHWEFWFMPRIIYRELFDVHLNGLHLTELKIAFSELKPIARFQVLSRATRTLGRVRVVAQKKEVRKESANGLRAFDDYDMIWSWIPERDDVDLEKPPPARSIRCSTLLGHDGDLLLADIRFTATKCATLDVQSIFVDTILEVSGFSRTCPVKIEYGTGVEIQQKMMRRDPVGKVFRFFDSRFSILGAEVRQRTL